MRPSRTCRQATSGWPRASTFSGTKKSPGTNHAPTTHRLFSEKTSDRHDRPQRQPRDVRERVAASG